MSLWCTQLVQRTLTWTTPCLSDPEDVVICTAGAQSSPPGGNISESFFLNYYQTAMQCVHIYIVSRPAPLINICGTTFTPACNAEGQLYVGYMGEVVLEHSDILFRLLYQFILKCAVLADCVLYIWGWTARYAIQRTESCVSESTTNKHLLLC